MFILIFEDGGIKSSPCCLFKNHICQVLTHSSGGPHLPIKRHRQWDEVPLTENNLKIMMIELMEEREILEKNKQYA